MKIRHAHARACNVLVRACLLSALLAAGCSGNQGDTQDTANVNAAAEAAADKGAAAFEEAYAKQNWQLAKAQGDVLNDQYPGSAAVERIQVRYEEAKQKALAAREEARLANLWSYSSEAVKGGTQLASTIFSKEGVDTDGSGAKPVQLVFRDRPGWGRSAYLVLKGGDFDCYGGCRLKLGLDGKTRTFRGERPNTDEAIAMFIRDERDLYRALDGVKELKVDFPVKKLGNRTAVFEVGGLDRTRLPDW